VPWWRPQHYYAGGERGSRARDGGGVLITQAIHALDLYQHLVGPVRAVSAHTWRTAVHEMECEDVVHAILQHDGPNAASLFATTAARAAQPEAIELYGTESTLRLVGSTLLLHHSGSTSFVVSEDVPTGAAEASAAGDWFVGLYRDVFHSWEQGRDPDCNGASALQTQRLVEATYRAVREHRWVPVAHDDYPDVSD
jgi:UDP-N-acetyl-2-amino-2-deoxyglucuronate dehydrogenase